MPGDRLAAIVARSPRLRALAERRVPRLQALIAHAGKVGNPYATSARALGAMLLAVPASLAAGILASVLLWPPAAIVCLAPAILYFWPELLLRDAASKRREGVERELPFFSILVNVLGGAGVSLYSVMVGVIGKGMFPAVEAEAVAVRRDVEVFGADPNEAVERVASSHPSRRFRYFLLGYTSKARSGGDMEAYLAGESGTLLRDLEEAWGRFAANSGTVGSMMVTVFGLIPLLLVVVGVFSPSASLGGLAVFTAVGVPGLTVLLVYMAGRLQPSGERPLHGRFRRSLALSFPAALLAAVPGHLWAGFGACLVVFFASYGLSVRRQMSEWREIDGAVPEFLKDLLEYKRQEYDLTRSLLSIASTDRYSPAFDALLERMAAQLKAAVPVDELDLDPKTSLGKLVFLVLGQMGRSGGGSVSTVYQLSAYAERVVEMKRSAVAQMRPYVVLSYASPVLLAFGVTFVGGLLRSYGSGAAAGLAAIGAAGGGFGGSAAAVAELSAVLTVASAAALGVVASKMADMTVRNTLRPMANVAVAMAATAALSYPGVQGLLRMVA